MFLFRYKAIYVLWWSAGRKTSTEFPLNGPRTFQTIDTADLAKAHGGWKENLRKWGQFITFQKEMVRVT